MESQNRISWEECIIKFKQDAKNADLVHDCFFDDPLSNAAQRYYLSEEWEEIRNIVGIKGGKALDVGAGLGISSFALAKDGWQTVALEPDPSSIVGAAAIRRLASEADVFIEVAETWGESLPFDDDSFELVHCRQVLHHARDLIGLCREIGRVLKPGGKFIATREHVIDGVEDLKIFLEKHPLHQFYGGENAYTLDQYCSSLRGAGIRITKVLNPFESNINLFPRTISGIKKNIATKTGIPTWLIPKIIFNLRGGFSKTPGRLYSFVGIKS